MIFSVFIAEKDQSVFDGVDRIVKEKGKIDVVVNNAGYHLVGAMEEISIEEMRAMFETNCFGGHSLFPIAVTT